MAAFRFLNLRGVFTAIFFLVASLSFSQKNITNELTKQHIKFGENHFAIIPPAGYTYSPATKEYLDKDKTSGIASEEVYKSIKQVWANYINQNGKPGVFEFSITKKDSFIIKGFTAYILEIKERNYPEKLVLIYGNDFLTIRIQSLSLNPQKRKEALAEMKKSFLSVVELTPEIFNAAYASGKRKQVEESMNDFMKKSDKRDKEVKELEKENTSRANPFLVTKTDKQEYRLGDTVRVISYFSIEGTSIVNTPKVIEPTYNEFTIVSGPNTSTSFSSNKGKQAYNYSFETLVLPKEVGEWVVPPIEIDYNGKKYVSNKVIIKINK